MITKSDYEKMAKYIAESKPLINLPPEPYRNYKLSFWKRKIEFIDNCFMATQDNYNSKLFLTACNYTK